MAQLLLNVGRDDRADFDNFYPGENARLLEYLQALAEIGQPVSARVVYLWGAHGAGKSHLLQALGKSAAAAGKTLREWSMGGEDGSAAALAEWLLVDELESLSGDLAAQRELLTAYEAIRQQPGVMVLAARHPPAELGLDLADLVSRLSAAEIFEVKPLNDAQKREALRQRADRRGFRLNDEVLNWLLGHASRDMGDLLALLDNVDTATLVEQRKVTVPLLKKVMATMAV